MAEPFKSCAADGCNRNAYHSAGGRGGLCASHRKRLARHGSPDSGRVGPGSVVQWLESKVDHLGDDCLIWPFARMSRGYGNLVWEGRHVCANRAMCILAHGDPPSEDSEAAHSCGNRICVNPRHLRWASPAENQADKLIHGTHIFGEKVPSAKMTEVDVIRARKIYQSGSTIRETASAVGFGEDTVREAIRGITWKHIPGAVCL